MYNHTLLNVKCADVIIIIIIIILELVTIVLEFYLQQSWRILLSFSKNINSIVPIHLQFVCNAAI